jgi:X-Pro dipeptidyl-peptidase
VPRGFAVVHSDSPGTGLSQGCPTVGAPNESLGPKAVIDWLNGRAAGFTTAEGDVPVVATWSTGKVGMTGTSYNGTLPLAAATTGVAGLEAIIPIAPNTSYYHYYRSNGLVRSPGGYLGEDIDFLYDYIHSGNPARRAYCNATVRDDEMAKGRDRETGDYNDFWAGRDYLNSVQNVKAAVLMAHAFNDWNVVPEHSVRIYEALKGRVPLMAYFHQGGHGGAPPMEMMNRWYSKYLYGVDNGVELGPRAFIVREPAAAPAPAGGAADSANAAAAARGRGARGRGGPAGELTPYADYPNPDARGVTLLPGAGGNTLGSLAIQNVASGARETLVDDVTHRGGALAQVEQSPNRLIYATPELAAPLHISGTPRVTVRLASDKAAANLSVWLVMLPWVGSPAGTANLITRGWADPQNHRSLTSSEPLVPGRFYDVIFNLQPDDQIIPAGRKIGLMIFSSDREFTVWPAPGTQLTVDLAGTSLVLPVVGGDAAWKAAAGR